MDRSDYRSRWERHLAAEARRFDGYRAPAAPQAESVPEWRRRATEQVRSYGHVAVWATSGMSAVL